MDKLFGGTQFTSQQKATHLMKYAIPNEKAFDTVERGPNLERERRLDTSLSARNPVILTESLHFYVPQFLCLQSDF